ncbi:MAG TPA: hypothetical protein VNK96_07130 [Fimbriimonadales bacterium]|nr:hypothetical protein [Fimbriimonadales bacterium]
MKNILANLLKTSFVCLFILSLIPFAYGEKPRFLWIRGGTVLGVNTIDYSPDGKLLATAGDDGTVKIWVARSGRLVRTIKASSGYYVIRVEFSPDGTLIASSGDDKMIKIWKVSDGTLVRSWVADPYLAYALSFSPDGTTIASGGTDAKVKLWDVATGALKKTLTGHTDYIYDVEYSHDGTRIVSASDDQTLRVWDANSGSLIWQVTAHDWYVIDADYSSDDLYIASVGGLDNPQLKIWNAANGSLVRSIKVDTFSVSECEWGPANVTILTTSRYGLKAWDVATGALLRHEPNGDMALALSPDGEIVTHTGASQVGLVESDTVYQRHFDDFSFIREVTAHTSAVTALDYSHKDDLLASGCSYFESAVKLRRANDGINLRTLYYTIVGDGVVDVKFSDDETMIAASGGDGDAKLYRVSDGALLQTFEHGDIGPLTVYSVAYHPNKLWFLTGGSDGLVKVWNINTGGQIAEWLPGNYPYDMDFSPQGTLLAVATNGGITIMNPSNGVVIRYITGHAKKVNEIEFTPDGNFIVSASDDGTCKLWDVNTGAVIRTFTGHSGAVYSMDLSPNGKKLISCGADNTVRIWDVSTGAQKALYDYETGAGFGGVYSVHFGKDEFQFAFGRADGTVAMALYDKHKDLILVSPQPPG